MKISIAAFQTHQKDPMCKEMCSYCLLEVSFPGDFLKVETEEDGNSFCLCAQCFKEIMFNKEEDTKNGT